MITGTELILFVIFVLGGAVVLAGIVICVLMILGYRINTYDP